MDAKDLIIEKQAAEIKTLKEAIETLREEIAGSRKIRAILPSRRRATLSSPKRVLLMGVAGNANAAANRGTPDVCVSLLVRTR
jgi:hypothetical protein